MVTRTTHPYIRYGEFAAALGSHQRRDTCRQSNMPAGFAASRVSMRTYGRSSGGPTGRPMLPENERYCVRYTIITY